MESSKVSDECSSSESGWTTYLASPSHGDSYYENKYNDDDDENENENENEGNISRNKRDDTNDSDDSMASDASSGPSNLEVSYNMGKRNHLLGQDQSKCISVQKFNQQLEKGKKYGVEKVVKGDTAFPTGYSKTAAKVRKNKKTAKK